MRRVQHHVPLLWAGLLLGGLNSAHAAPGSADGKPVDGSGSRNLVPVHQTSRGDTARARQHYALAVELYDAQRYAAALSEFRRAAALRPNYQLLFNIGQLELLLSRHAAARQSLMRYLDEGGARVSAHRRRQVLEQLRALDEGTARAPVEPVSAEPPEAASSATPSSVRAERATAARPSAARVELHPRATVAWVSTGVLGLGALGSGIATLLTSRHYDQLRGRAVPSGEAERARAKLDRQRALVSDLAIATDVLAIATLAGASLSLYFTLSDDSARPAEPELSLELSPRGVVAAGRF